MKKYLLLILLIPIVVCAKTDYTINKFYVDASINTNGDILIQETITITGIIDSFTREINYRNSLLEYNDPIDFSSDAIYNGTSLENVSIEAKQKDDKEYTTLTKVYYDEDAKNNNYVEKSLSDGKRYKIYYSSNNNQIELKISYTIKSVIVKHQDIIELYWPFINKINDNIEQTKINIHFQEEINPEILKVYVHESEDAQIYYLSENTIDSKGIEITPKNNISTPINIRLIYKSNNTESIPFNKCSNTIALKKIIELERKIEEEHTAKQEEYVRINKSINDITVISLIILAFWWIFVYFKYIKRYKSSFKEEYYHDIPKNYNVEVSPYLLYGEITKESLPASIMNLIIKKNITYEKKKEDYIFILNNTNKTTETENVLIDLLFNKIGHNNTFTIKEIKKYKTKDTYPKYYNNWLNCVEKDAQKEEFYERNGIPIISSIFILFASIMIVFANFFFNINDYNTITLLPLSIIFMIISLNIKRKTIKGEEEYSKLISLKNYLNSKDYIPKKEHIPYNIIFNIHKKTDEKAHTKLNEYINIATYLANHLTK